MKTQLDKNTSFCIAKLVYKFAMLMTLIQSNLLDKNINTILTEDIQQHGHYHPYSNIQDAWVNETTHQLFTV